jgi:hypothetical protein
MLTLKVAFFVFLFFYLADFESLVAEEEEEARYVAEV